MYGNRHAPSKDILDIAQKFAVLEHLRFICSGGLILLMKADNIRNKFNNYIIECYHCLLYIHLRCGRGLTEIYEHPIVQNFINQQPVKYLLRNKTIYQPGCLRKVCLYACSTYIKLCSFLFVLAA